MIAGLPETFGATDGVGASARLWDPAFFAFDNSNNIILADVDDGSMRKITPDSVVTTILKGVFGQIDIQGGVAVDKSGNIYFADDVWSSILKASPSGVVTVLAGNGKSGFADGPGNSAMFSEPGGVALDGNGALYVADALNYSIRKISLSGYNIDKPLPPGLTFDPTTGIITGTPKATSPAADYTITAYNNSGSSSTVVSIAVSNNASGNRPAMISPISAPKHTRAIKPSRRCRQPILAAAFRRYIRPGGNHLLPVRKAGSVNGTGKRSKYFWPIGFGHRCGRRCFCGRL